MKKGINRSVEKNLFNLIFRSLLDALSNPNRYRVGTKFDYVSIRMHACMVVDEIDKTCTVSRRSRPRIGRLSTESSIKEAQRQNKRARDAQVRQLIRSASDSTKLPKQPN